MVRIGLVGIGFMGWIHFLAYRRLRGAVLAGVCSRDAGKLSGDWKSIRGNFGPPGEQVDLSGVKKFRAIEEMAADPDIDLIDVCNPTHLHPETAIAALKAGKHVLVEKAIALTTAEADAMVAASKASGKLLMVAHVLPFFPEFKYAAEVVKSGADGKLLSAHFRRVISRPDWSADIGDAAKTGGPAVDLHIHDTHFIGLIAGVPESVFATGVVENGVVQHLTTSYDYGPNGPSITCSSGALAMSGRPFTHGYELYLEKATLVYEAGSPITRITAGKSEVVTLPGGGDEITAFAEEIQTAVDAVTTGQMPDLLSGQLARDALVMCQKECESVISRKPVKI
ncbi:Gfo/Idh/MocA family protein [Zavarzinella formosa]|uniref:Gfo/Idh/MocA family protein n=1 Tax=Zavarzinella formosa TaxID=360055 RepID=UPI000497B75B|nr:Gfo/Idh/MocA family oxidoreductase [Zavarzinella formosa]